MKRALLVVMHTLPHSNITNSSDGNCYKIRECALACCRGVSTCYVCDKSCESLMSTATNIILWYQSNLIDHSHPFPELANKNKTQHAMTDIMVHSSYHTHLVDTATV